LKKALLHEIFIVKFVLLVIFSLKSVSNPVDTFSWDERTLVSLLKQGNEDAYRVLIRQYQQMVFRIAYGITLDKEESLDISQEVFLKVYQNIRSFEAKAKLSTWLHRITVNQSLNWKRRWRVRLRWHHQPLEDPEYPEPGTDENAPEVLYRNKESRRLLWEGLKDLPADARAVFVLKELEGFSYEEIAQILKIKRGTVSSRLFYARKKLKASLKEHLDET
jgi:RNA polymerase sigma-70 factor (ECF subfamily)